MPKSEVQQVVFGGDGLIREESGRVVFVPYVLPGEKIEYAITHEEKWLARGRLEKLLLPHPLRVEPRCNHYGTCDGCQLQHAPIEEQLLFKRAWLRDLLKRIAHIDIDVPPLVACEPWEYRRSVEWTWKEDALGYSSAKGELIPIKECLLLKQSTFAIEKTRTLLLEIGVASGRVRWLRGCEADSSVDKEHDHKPIWILDTEQQLSKEALKKAWESSKSYFSGWIIHHKRQLQQTFGEITQEALVADLRIRWHGLSFVQNNFAGSVAFYKWIERHLERAKPGERLLDLYCGVGITSLLAARRGYSAVGLEISPLAIECAKHNASVNGYAPSLEFRTCDLNRLQINGNFSHWIANPPRTGLSESLFSAIQRQRPEHLFYLSCHPATLARDIKKMSDLGFTIEAIQAFDCFAQTTHFETAIYLRRRTAI